MSKICTAAEAVADIRAGQASGSVGVIGWLTPDALFQALAQRFRETAAPRDLSFFFPVSVGDAMGIRGMDHVAIEGLMKRVVSGNFINAVDPATGRQSGGQITRRRGLADAAFLVRDAEDPGHFVGSLVMVQCTFRSGRRVGGTRVRQGFGASRGPGSAAIDRGHARAWRTVAECT